MKKEEILKALKSFPYDPEEYWLTAGAAMVMYGLRRETADIDLGCTSELADRLENDGFLHRRTEDGNRWFKVGDDIEVFENWVYDGTVFIEGCRVITPEGLIAAKEALGREKDLKDIELIRSYLAERSDGSVNVSAVSLQPMTREMYHSFFQEYENDPDLFTEGQEYTPYVYSEEKVDRYIQRQQDLKRISLAVMYGNEIAGEIILKNIEENRCATMGLALKNDRYKNRGIGTQAERLAVRYVFDALDIPVLYADSLKTNTRSWHVLEKVGFRFIREDDNFRYYMIER